MVRQRPIHCKAFSALVRPSLKSPPGATSGAGNRGSRKRRHSGGWLKIQVELIDPEVFANHRVPMQREVIQNPLTNLRMGLDADERWLEPMYRTRQALLARIVGSSMLSKSRRLMPAASSTAFRVDVGISRRSTLSDCLLANASSDDAVSTRVVGTKNCTRPSPASDTNTETNFVLGRCAAYPGPIFHLCVNRHA